MPREEAGYTRKRTLVVAGLGTLLVVAGLAFYLFRPLSVTPEPAPVTCYDLGQGAYVPLDVPPQAFGVGLSYATHIEETASTYDPRGRPPVFKKHPRGVIRTGGKVRRPTREEIIAAADVLEPGLGGRLEEDFSELPPLLDYEVELGLVLLDDIDPSDLADPTFAPPLGFFIANDLSARSLALLGEGERSRYTYWGASKSFAGFMPVADRAWVPQTPDTNAIPCVEIETIVNGEVRQRQSTTDLIYTPRQMLEFVHAAFPEASLSKGTIVLTGTPGGVAMTTPRWLVRLANALQLSRFRKLSSKLSNRNEAFLDVGDRVTVRGQGLGKVSVTISP
ncbi:MAG: fumarylacetoacetate hydrolase family protein [Myxococcota bacterium]